MFRLFKYLKKDLLIFIGVVLLFASSAMAELYLPGMMSDIINDGIYLDYEPMYEHETMENPFGTLDIVGNVEGFDKSRIPVFEMKDGFSTIDIKNEWRISKTSGILFNFRDIPVKDSRELFLNVLIPFMNSLKEYQFYKVSERYGYKVDSFSSYRDYDYEYNGKTYNDRLEVEKAISKLIDFNSLLAVPASSSPNINTFLSMVESDDPKDGDMWDDDNAKALLTACVLCMKHSANGNILPIPIMKNEKGETVRVSVDANGEALDKSLLTYKYDSETGRKLPFPDYEAIMCNKVLGYAYKYVDGQKWIYNEPGMSSADITQKVGKNVAEATGIKKFFQILSLSKKGSSTDALKIKGEKGGKSREEWLTPDGVTIQKADMDYIGKKGITMLLLTVLAVACTGVGNVLSRENRCELF